MDIDMIIQLKLEDELFHYLVIPLSEIQSLDFS